MCVRLYELNGDIIMINIKDKDLEEWSVDYPFTAYLVSSTDTFEERVAYAESIYCNQ